VTAFALLLILLAAFSHASWNYLLKRSQGGTLFVWLFATISAGLYAPLAIGVVWWTKPQFGWIHFGLMFASGLLHTGYYMLLDRGYRSGDLSLVYPLARASGPLLTVLCAVFVLREHPSAVAIAGALLVGLGAVVLTGNPLQIKEAGNLPAIGFALLTGCMIASYTLVDKIAVAEFSIPPVLQDWAANLGRVVLMTPLAFGSRAHLKPTWRRTKREIIAVAVLCPLSYILVLTAMVFTPVSYVAPAREISILIGAIMGAHLLAEGYAARRITGATAMLAGLACLALG